LVGRKGRIPVKDEFVVIYQDKQYKHWHVLSHRRARDGRLVPEAFQVWDLASERAKAFEAENKRHGVVVKCHVCLRVVDPASQLK
jgi:hypothetical protein